MRIIVLSDTHGEETTVRWLLEQAWRTLGPVDVYLHCGDGAGDFARLENFIRARDEHALLYGVRGNCDFCAHDVPDMRVMPLGGTSVFMTHGHLYRAKSTYTYLDEAAYERGCTVTLFGHTHSPCVETRRTLMINPGSAADGRLALLELNDGRPRVNLLSY